jgi:CheY-like chemotaxis protein
LGPIKTDPTHIEQIILNLAVNARDAMPDGGRLLIETSNIRLDQAYATQHIGVHPGNYILLTITDSGHGISQAVKEHIFEPFFTTKEMGKGTGLGLATVFGIVKQNRGNILVESEEGLGTTFRVYLPSSSETMPAPARAPAELPILPGHETILIVEDNAEVRGLARRILQKQGYTLLEVQNGQEALQLVTQYPEPIHLVLTDMIMPGMNGKVLAEELLRRRPELKIIFMSGYANNIIAEPGDLNSQSAFVQKPFSAKTLVQKIQAALDS